MNNVENFKSAARWKRIVALAIDTALLFFLGWIFGVIFKDQWIRLGGLSRFAGYLVAGIYYTVSCSYHFDGQTFGKYLVKIKVVEVGGGKLSIFKSFLRFNVYGLPHFLNGAFSDYLDPLSFFEQFIGVLLFFTLFSNLYLLLLSKPKRTLSDLFCKTVVVPVEAMELNPPAIRRGDLFAVSFLGLVVVATSVYFLKQADDGFLADVNKTYRAIQVAAKTNRVTVNQNTNTVTSSSGKSITRSYRIQLMNPVHSNQDSVFARGIADVALESNTSIKSVDFIYVGLVTGIDIGIYSGWTTNHFTYRPADLMVAK